MSEGTSFGVHRLVGRARGRVCPDDSDDPQTSTVGNYKRLRVDPGPSTAPDTVVETVQRCVGSSSTASDHTRIPYLLRTRPAHLVDKKGTSGTPLTLQANYFKLCSQPDWHLYKYKVNFKPYDDRIRVRKALLKKHKETLGAYVYDGNFLYTNHKLPIQLFMKSRREKDDNDITISTQLIFQLSNTDKEYMHFFNSLIRKCMAALKLHLVGRHFYDPLAKICVDQYKLEIWPGYITSIRRYEDEILLCAEVTHKIMRKETVQDLLTRIQNSEGQDFEAKFKHAVLGLIVLTDYNNKTYRVDDINFMLNPLSKFKLKNNREITFADYYFEKYCIRIRCMTQPLLVSRSKVKDLYAGAAEIVYLIPELCRVTGLTSDMRTNFQLMKSINVHTQVGPKERINKLVSFSHRLMGQTEVREELEKWQMEVVPKLIKFQGRKLQPEKIVQGQVGNEIMYDVSHYGDWTSNLRINPLLSIGKLHLWAMICPSYFVSKAESFYKLLRQVAAGMSMLVNIPYYHLIDDDRQGTYVNEIENVLSQMNPQLLMCVVSNNRPERYTAIKKKCLLDRSVPNQVVTVRSMGNKGAMYIATKIAIQINCKIGGAPWTVPNPCKSDMVVGIDASQDYLNRNNIYGALVASLNKTMSRFFSLVSVHNSGEDISNDLPVKLLKALNRFRSTNDDHLPARIFIYRDGLGEFNAEHVYKHEVHIIKNALSQLYGGHDRYRLTFITINKRINTRIFTAQSGNPEPGTIVDSCITLPERFDFFLVSQSVRQGTVSPTSYNVIFDNSGFTPDMIQRYTYKMTHLYFNWSGTVRFPAPVQYAHKLARLASQYMHCVPATNLDDTLYFL